MHDGGFSYNDYYLNKIEMPRRKPFSNKQRKQQLQEKRVKKKEKGGELHSDPAVVEQVLHETTDLVGLNTQPLSAPPTQGEVELGARATKRNPNRFCLQFGRESNEEIERRKLVAKTTPITSVAEHELESSVEDVYLADSALDIPRRPPWNYAMSKEELEASEEKAFESYLEKIHSKYTISQLSYFEHNLETWRQLWRVLEMSDVILLITDIRHPALHFSPALYAYVVQELQKRLVLVLNKIDLVPPSVGVAWRHYFLSHFPGLDVICFTSYPSNPPPEKVKLKMHRKRGRLPCAVGPRELMNVVQQMYHGKVDLSAWKQKLDEATSREVETPPPDMGLDSDSSEEDEEEHCPPDSASSSSHFEQSENTASKGVLTIGMVGHPNVGKSSIINGLMGKKLVSTSRTPGHTKHFQTLFLTPTLRLCDCPGLVFPSLVDKQLQILSGIFPVAQVREPYTVVGYLAQRTALIKQLQLVHPDCYGPKKNPAKKVEDRRLKGRGRGAEPHTTEKLLSAVNRKWTPWDICDSWAIRRGYYTSRAARPDTYKAANNILRLAVEGKIVLYFKPPGFTERKVEWEGHPEVAEMVELQRAGLQESGQEQLQEEGEEGSTVLAYMESGRSELVMEEEEGEEGSRGNQFAVLAGMESGVSVMEEEEEEGSRGNQFAALAGTED